MLRILAVFGLLASNLFVGGCIPDQIMIDLAPSDPRLEEKVVLSDDSPGNSKVALIEITGLISHAAAGGLVPSGGNSVDRLVAQLEKAEDDPQVKAVVLRINSPGGSVAASETMYAEIERFRHDSGKPIVVSMSEVAASGGYYIALAADRIYAQPSSITGSIGVLIQTINFAEGMRRVGIESRTVTSGSNKDMASPLEPMQEEHYAILQSTVDEFYVSFRELVVSQRGQALAQSRVDMLTDGRVFTGAQALEHGLVDENGGLRDAFAGAQSLAGLEGAKLVKYHRPGREPATAYSAVSPVPSAGTEINILQLNVPPITRLSSGFYYLWAPANQ